MRRVLTLVVALLALSIVAPGIVVAPAVFTGVVGTMSMTATWPGDIYVLQSGMVRQVGAEASGPIVSSDPRLNGVLEIVLYAVFSLNTGDGVGFGSFTISGAEGTFEGRFTVKDSNYISFQGRLEGRGTAAYEGLQLKLEMTGTDWYRDADPGTNGIFADFVGYIASPQGA